MKLLIRFALTVGLAFGLGLAALPAADDPPQFSAWSAPVNLGPVVNVWGDWRVAYDACPTISKDGLSLYFRSNRPGGQGSYNTFDIWVAVVSWLGREGPPRAEEILVDGRESAAFTVDLRADDPAVVDLLTGFQEQAARVGDAQARVKLPPFFQNLRREDVRRSLPVRLEVVRWPAEGEAVAPWVARFTLVGGRGRRGSRCACSRGSSRAGRAPTGRRSTASRSSSSAPRATPSPPRSSATACSSRASRPRCAGRSKAAGRPITGERSVATAPHET